MHVDSTQGVPCAAGDPLATDGHDPVPGGGLHGAGSEERGASSSALPDAELGAAVSGELPRVEAPAEAVKRRKKTESPTARALKECRKRGWTSQVVERWNAWAKKRLDLFGVIDVVAITPDGILGIQVTTGTNHASRREKILAEPNVRAWVAAGGRFELWSYAQRGASGKRKLWTLRVETFADMTQEAR
jgi:hypothetical protein